MQLVQQWRQIEATLPEGWREARLSLVPEERSQLGRAAAILGPANAGRAGEALVLTARVASYPSPEHVRRLFRRLDEARIWATLTLVESAVEAPTAAPEPALTGSLVAAWGEALAELPEGWSDLLCSLELDSSDFLPRAALLCAPLNPTRDPAIIGFLFRCAQRKGYGVSPGMARACFARLDGEDIQGRVAVRRVLSSTSNVATQGPVWYVGGRAL